MTPAGTSHDPHAWLLAGGYRFAGLHCGIRPDRDRMDLAVVVSDRPAAAAGVFTQNRVRAAPVRVCQERLPADDVRGVIVCSGNANACTGPQGLTDARRMTALAAQGLGVREEQFLVASTGVIGRHLPMAQVEDGIRRIVPMAAPGSLEDMARAILTTDTVIKLYSARAGTRRRADPPHRRRQGGGDDRAEHGDDARVRLHGRLGEQRADLAPLVRRAASKTFNCVSVEGHTSTNDTLLAAGERPRGRAAPRGR